MPLVRVTTSAAPLSESDRAALLGRLSRAAAELFGKPERWVMVCLDPVATMSFGGSTDPAAYVEVKNIGALPGSLAKRVSKAVTDIVSSGLGVPVDRVYVEMAAASAEHWAHAGDTFA